MEATAKGGVVEWEWEEVMEWRKKWPFLWYNLLLLSQPRTVTELQHLNEMIISYHRKFDWRTRVASLFPPSQARDDQERLCIQG